MPPPWHHQVSPAVASLTAPPRCEVACSHKGQQSQNYEPEARFLCTSSHGILLWQVAKGISAEWNENVHLWFAHCIEISAEPPPKKKGQSEIMSQFVWHLHFEQCCLQTCVSTCHLGNHVPRIVGQIHSKEVVTQQLPGYPAWTLLQTPNSFWGKPRNWTDNPKTLREILLCK